MNMNMSMSELATPLKNFFFNELKTVIDATGSLPPKNEDFTIFSTDESVCICVDLPGVEKQDIKIECEEDRMVVTIVATRYGARHKQFNHVFKLPSECLIDNTDASLELGVLSVKFAKKQSKSTKNINVV
jgi:HSP20 family molecular chaperone IbpA